jgi:subtilisin family serine protease
MHLAICDSVAAGVTYVVAAGNDAADMQGSIPAAYDEVLTAAGLRDYDGLPGGFGSPGSECPSTNPLDDGAFLLSNFATLASDQAHTIAAPGVCILSTVAPGSHLFPGTELYGTISGTSMSSPHVAGTVALCIATGACAGLTPAQIIQKLRGDAEKYNTTKGKDYGFIGDPLRPFDGGQYYGYLIRAASY